MSIQDQFEREEDSLCTMYNEGRITLAEYKKEMRELQREYRAMAEESAQGAYDDEMGRW